MNDFITDILPLYLNHEKTFDPMGIHGRRHLIRSLIFAEIITRFYYLLGESSLDFNRIRTAVAFHDSGRKGNGIDHWEQESAKNCEGYLKKMGKSEDYIRKTSEMILLKKGEIKTREQQIVYDVDVIEIIRILSNRNQFINEKLLFLGDNMFHNDYPRSILNLRCQFLNEFWGFIKQTEYNIDELNNKWLEYTLIDKFQEYSNNLNNNKLVQNFISLFKNDKGKYYLMNKHYDFIA